MGPLLEVAEHGARYRADAFDLYQRADRSVAPVKKGNASCTGSLAGSADG
jgi:hypothetical protein